MALKQRGEETRIGECRRCRTFCDKLIEPRGCIELDCRYLYSYHDALSGSRYMGCLRKVFRAEIDIDLFEDAEQTGGFGGIKMTGHPLPQCQFRGRFIVRRQRRSASSASSRATKASARPTSASTPASSTAPTSGRRGCGRSTCATLWPERHARARSAQHPRDPRWVFEHLAVRDADHLIAHEPQLRVAGAIGLKGGAVAVMLPAIRLDYELLGSPEEVDPMRPDPYVHVGQRQAVAAAEMEHRPLEAASRRLGSGETADWQVEEAGAVERILPLLVREKGLQVGERSRRLRRRDPVAQHDVRCRQRAGAVDDDAVALTSAAGARHRHVHRARTGI